MFETCDPANTPPAVSPKRTAILGAAAALFTTQGYGAVSMDAVAKEAGVSKATLYAHFTGKDALFAEMMAARVHAVHPAQSLALHDGLPGATLPVIGRRWLSFMLAPEAMAIFRIVVAEGARFPDLAHAFYAAGPERASPGAPPGLPRRSGWAGCAPIPTRARRRRS